MGPLADIITWSDLGLTGLLTVGIVMILTGRLVPRSTVEQMRAERDARLTDLLAAHQAEVEARKLTIQQVSELEENSRVTVELLRALRDRARENP